MASNGKDTKTVQQEASLQSKSPSVKPDGHHEKTESDITEEDLTDPDSLLEKLNNVDLTEEDTELLLHEAYKVNMKLKEILRRQEENDIQLRRTHTTGGLSGKPGKLNSHKSPLPPISGEEIKREVYTAYASTRTSPTRESRIGSSKGKVHLSPSRRKSSAKQSKPEWDSRFSFS